MFVAALVTTVISSERLAQVPQLRNESAVLESRLDRALRQREDIISQRANLRGGVSPNGWFVLSSASSMPGRMLSVLSKLVGTSPFAQVSGSASGGVWRTGPNGWECANPYLGALSVSDLVFDPQTESKIYAATGDGYDDGVFGKSPSSPMPGAGIFKSEDGGEIWSQMPSTRHWEIVNKVSVHPTNPNLLMAATSTGLFRSTDGGVTWNLSLPGFACSVAIRQLNDSAPSQEFEASASFDLRTPVQRGRSSPRCLEAGSRLSLPRLIPS